MQVFRFLIFVGCLLGAFAAGTLFPTMSGQAHAQQARPKPVADWLTVTFMKVPGDKDAAYLRIEREHWKAVHEQLIKEGTTRYWALYRVRSGNEPKPEWSYVTMSSYSKPDPNILYPRIYSALNRALPYAELLKQTLESREILRTERYELVDFVH
jgi:hypothetical protein